MMSVWSPVKAFLNGTFAVFSRKFGRVIVGEAKKKKMELEAWRSQLTHDEVLIDAAATAVFDQFVQPLKAVGMCYRLAFFLTEYLAAKGVTVEPIVGYINDGTGDIMTSHAWVEHGGRRVDLSLTYTEFPDVQLPGQMLILDRVAKSGTAYTYHRNQGDDALRTLEAVKRDPRYRELAMRKDAEHAMMVDTAQSSAARRRYLDGAPDGFDFARIAAIVDGLDPV